MWQELQILQYVKGTLPVPVIQHTDGNKFRFVPNNLKDQHPNFAGYLTWIRQDNGREQSIQFPVSIQDGKPHLTYMPKLDPVQVVQGLKLCIELAQREGYVFPSALAS